MFVLYAASVNPNTAACINPSELNLGSLRGVTGTAMFNLNISPNIGKKLLINGLPAVSGLPSVLPVANWYGGKLGTPV